MSTMPYFALLIGLLGIISSSTAQTIPSGATVREVFAYINQARSKPCRCGTIKYPAAAPLLYNEKLAVAAQKHAGWMAATFKLSHTETSRDAANSWDRINKEGYLWSTVAENIAAGQPTAREVVDAWIHSPGHCKNLMDGAVKEVGIGLAYTASGKYHYYWVLDFAAPR